MSQVNAANSLSQIMADIDLGPTGSIQFLFAKLQMAQSQICKSQAESYMKQIETIQEEQKACAEMIEIARQLQQAAKMVPVTARGTAMLLSCHKKWLTFSTKEVSASTPAVVKETMSIMRTNGITTLSL